MKITRKGYADDELLQYPTLQSQLFQTTHDKLAETGITSYSKLLEVVSNESTKPDIRATAAWTIGTVLKALDKRHVIKPLLKALDSSHEEVRNAAVHSLSWLKSPHVVSILVNLACDKQESFNVRLLAIQGLSTNKTIDFFTRLRAIVFDETDDIRIRAEALEWLEYPPDFDSINDFINLLQSPLPDLRFWAAYRLSQENEDISEALNALDNVAAFDHTVPPTWGWHIDREALRGLEGIYWHLLHLNDQDEDEIHSPRPFLISPAPEYSTFEWRFLKYQKDGFFKKLPQPHITFQVEANWLAEQLRQEWPSVKLNVREPRPQTYVVDWLLEIDGESLIGGLHRDQYAVVLTGSRAVIRRFAAWYRSIIEAKQYLFLYEWAGLAVELRTGMSAADVEVEQLQRDKNMNAVHEQSIEYPWVIETD